MGLICDFLQTSLSVPGLAEKRPSVVIGKYPPDAKYVTPLNVELQVMLSLSEQLALRPTSGIKATFILYAS